jgi:hypothetical protein
MNEQVAVGHSDLAVKLMRITEKYTAQFIPGDKKFAFVFGGNYGRGVATCRTVHGWIAPVFIAIEGGSVGYQIGGSSTDLVMLFMNDEALHHPLSDKFKLGGDASVAAPWAATPPPPQMYRSTPRFFLTRAPGAFLLESAWTAPWSGLIRVGMKPCTERM